MMSDDVGDEEEEEDVDGDEACWSMRVADEGGEVIEGAKRAF